MARLPPPYPHQVVSDWIAANDNHVLTASVERAPLDYDVSARRARKMQAKAIAVVDRHIGKRIGRIVTNATTFLHDHWCTRRQIKRLSYLPPRMLDDIGIPHEIQVRIRVLHAHRQPHRLHFYF